MLLFLSLFIFSKTSTAGVAKKRMDSGLIIPGSPATSLENSRLSPLFAAVLLGTSLFSLELNTQYLKGGANNWLVIHLAEELSEPFVTSHGRVCLSIRCMRSGASQMLLTSREALESKSNVNPV